MRVKRLADLGSLPRIETRPFVDGEFVAAGGDRALRTCYPATNETLADVPSASAGDVARAVGAARRAFDRGPWARSPAEARAAALERVAAALEANADEFARLTCLDNGKTLRESRADVAHAVGSLRSASRLAPQLRGETLPYHPDLVQYSLREPLGVVAGILPFNVPLVIGAVVAAPALAAGNAVVLKPSPLAPLAVLRFAELGRDAGLPPGVLNAVCGGNDVSEWLAGHPDVDMISLTGSVAAGQKILELAARGIKRTLLELGGKSANIVFADADLPRALAGALTGVFPNGGQVCFASPRLLVERSLYEPFVQRLAQRAAAIRVGDPFDDATQMGALISPEQTERVAAAVDRARADGAVVRAGGSRPAGLEAEGCFYAPTVLSGVDPAMPIAREEVFGPVLCVLPFDTEEQAVEMANDSEFGLAGALWTKDVERVQRVVRAVRTGRVWVNTYAAPGGGVPLGGYKKSGFGRIAGLRGLEEYTELKAVIMDVSGKTGRHYE